MLAVIAPYAQTPAPPTGSAVIDAVDPTLVTAGPAGVGTSSIAYAVAQPADQAVPISQQGIAAGLVPLGTSTQAAGWVGPSPINTARQVGDFAAEAPDPGVNQTPFRKPILQRLALAIFPPMKNEWAVFSRGDHGSLPAQPAASAPSQAAPFANVRGNSYRLQPKPWDSDLWIGATPGSA